VLAVLAVSVLEQALVGAVAAHLQMEALLVPAETVLPVGLSLLLISNYEIRTN
jgi:hypothetical protein